MGDSEQNLPPPELSPRLCHLEKWPDFNGYGFNLHAERGKAGQFIGKVDEGSPAEKADLRQGDKIVEVNKINVLNQNHHQVVTMIRESGDKVNLLVIDKPTEEYYKKHNMTITSDATNVIFCDGRSRDGPGATDEEPVVNGDHVEEEAVVEVESSAVVESAPVVETAVVVESVPDVESEPEIQSPPTPPPDFEDDARDPTPPPPPILTEDEPDGEVVEEVVTQQETTVVHAAPEPEKPPTPEPEKLPTPEVVPEQNGNKPEDPLSFKLSAKEYREQMVKKKEKDARNKAMGFKAKKDAFDQL